MNRINEQHTHAMLSEGSEILTSQVREIYHVTDKRIWLSGSYLDFLEDAPEWLRLVADGTCNGYDMRGNCLISVPHDKVNTYSSEEAESILAAMASDEALMRAAY